MPTSELPYDELAEILGRPEAELRAWGPHSSLRAEVGLDSIELLEMAILLEYAVGAELDEDLLASIDTLAGFAGWLTWTPADGHSPS